MGEANFADARHAGALVPLFSIPSGESWGIGEIPDLSRFAAWLDQSAATSAEEWVKLFRKTFVFTGGEITTSFLISIGYLPGAHDETCPVYKRVLRAKPRWATAR